MPGSRPNPRERLQTARLYLVAPAHPHGIPLVELLPGLLEAGVDMVQLRDKDLGDRALVEVARAALKITRRFGALMVVNDRVDLAMACGADGVHLGQDDLDPGDARRQLGPGPLIGISTHSEAQIAAAAAEADYLAVGPVFATPTKPGATPVGTDLVRFASNATSRPFFAIGGIDASNLGEVVSAGASRVAVIRALVAREDPAGQARRLRRMLDS